MAAHALLVLLAALAAPAAVAEGFDYDVALRGGRLYRGGAELAGPGDVAVRGDRIVAVGNAPGRARREIDASGLVVAPGFIDLHTHSDEVFRRFGWLPLLPGSLAGHDNYLTQGVTTVVTGNCGSGFATPDEIAAWLERVDETPFGPNVIHLVPQGQLRLDVMGEAQADRADPAPTAEEMARMKELLDGGMRAGAWGMSTGLEYDPGARSDTDELVELMEVVARHRGVYASHTRHEGPDPARTLASYAEAIEIGERAGTPAHISHIKLSGPPVHGMTDAVIELVEAARARGVRVTADQYPYAAGSTALSIVAPPEMRDGTSVLDRYCEGEGRAALRAGVADRLAVELPPEAIQISVYPWRWWLQGRRVSEVAAERGADPVDVAMDLACGPIGLGIFHSQSEADVRRFMAEDWVATASDATASPGIVGRAIHPRAYGTFPRKIRRYALDEGVISLGHALRSMTELPAKAFDIPGRGRLEPDAWADVVAFDPERLLDVATYERSGRHSEGVEYLLVNGVLAVDAGEPTGDHAGRALRHGSLQHEVLQREGPGASLPLAEAGAERLPHSLQIWDNAARLGLPTPLKAWLLLLVLTFLASVFFVRRHRVARWALAGFVFSHALVLAIEGSGITPLRVGLVSLTHVLGWTPALVALVRDLPAASPRSRYGRWCRLLLFIIGVALIFDVRDATMYVYYRLTGHSALP